MCVCIHQPFCARHVTLCTTLVISPLPVNSNSNRMAIPSPHCSWAGYQTPHCDATHGLLRNPAYSLQILLGTCNTFRLKSWKLEVALLDCEEVMNLKFKHPIKQVNIVIFWHTIRWFCIMGSIICTLHQILLWWSSKGGWDGQGM
jgi:hypothetical protein